MGTYAWLYARESSGIPDNKRAEFVKKIEKIFQTGGMMDMEYTRLCGKDFYTIHKAKMHKSGMNFVYNYYEDNHWENAGFDRELCCVWSDKIGESQFHMVVVAAYVLEEMYTEGTVAAMVDGEPVKFRGYVGWLNYLFNEQNYIKNYDPWKLFESFHYSKQKYDKGFVVDYKSYGFTGSCEIVAVLKGTDIAILKSAGKEKNTIERLVLSSMKNIKILLTKYKENSNEDYETQLNQLLDAVRIEYEQHSKLDICNEELKKIMESIFISDAPAFAIKAIAETYNKDFWDLWEQIHDVAKRRMSVIYGSDSYYITPITTADFLKQSPDDMIPYWKEDVDFEFSKELCDWFKMLKCKFDTIINSEFSIGKPLRYVVDLIVEANENYYQIYTFSEFLEETLVNLKDKRYLTLWKLYDEMLKDPKLMEAGEVIFVPEGPEFEHIGLQYTGIGPKRRLIKNWDNIDMDKRNNEARVTLRRYMALVANKPLRKKVFGF